MPVCVPVLNHVSRSVGGQFLRCRHEYRRICGRGMVAFEIRSEEGGNRSFAIVGDIHQKNQVIILILVEADFDLLASSKATESVRALLQDGEMKVRSLPWFPAKHL